MKIICESLDEYDKLMRASKYLHDFRIDIEDFEDDKDRIFGINDNDDEIIGFLQHLYLTVDDLPNKRELVSIESCQTKEKVFSEIMHTPLKGLSSRGLDNEKS